MAASLLDRDDVSGPLYTNFLGAPGSVPQISARLVSDGQLPSSALRDRVLVVGPTAAVSQREWNTPVGAMAPAEVMTHALATAADDAGRTPVPAWLAMVGAVLASVLGAMLGRARHRDGAGRWVAAGLGLGASAALLTALWTASGDGLAVPAAMWGMSFVFATVAAWVLGSPLLAAVWRVCSRAGAPPSETVSPSQSDVRPEVRAV